MFFIKSKQEESLKKFLIKKIILTAVGITLIGILLIFITLGVLKIYTNHGESIKVPVVKGMDIEQAQLLLQQNDLRYEIVDSLYIGAKPGTVIEIIPEENSNIKKNRVLYLKMQARGQQMISVPELINYSERQATSILKSLGFNNITIETRTSIYKNLVLDVLHKGSSLKSLDKIAKGSPITLIVGTGGETAIDSIIDFTPDNYNEFDSYIEENEPIDDSNPYFD